MTERPFRIGLRKLVGTSLVMQGTGLGLLTLAQIVIARALGASEYGTFSYAAACASTMVAVGKFGTDTLAYRYGGQYFAAGDWRNIAALFRHMQTLAIKASGVAYALLVLYSVILYEKRSDETLSLAIAVAALAVPILAMSTLRQAILITAEKVFLGLASDHLLRMGTLILSVALLSTLGAASAISLTVANVCSYAVALLCSEYWIRRHTPLTGVEASSAPNATQLNRAASGLFFLSAMHILHTQYDLLIVGYLFDSTATGIYAASKQISSVAMLGLFAMQLVVSPRIAAAYHARDSVTFRRLIRMVTIGGTAFTLVYGLLLVVAGAQALALFGPEFDAGHSSLLWLLSAQLVNALAGPAGAVASMLGLQFGAAAIYAGAVTIGMLATLILCPIFGIDGAAISALLTTAGACIGLNILLSRTVGSVVWAGQLLDTKTSG